METENIITHEPVIIGSTFYGDSYEFYEVINNVRVPVNLTGSVVRMDFRDRYKKLILSLDTASGDIQISDNAIIIPEMIFSVPEGEYMSDMSITMVSGDVLGGLIKTKWKFINPITTAV